MDSRWYMKQDSHTPDVARMEEIVRFQVEGKRFMGAVLVARHGEVLLSRGYGLASLEWNRPNTPSTKFRIGSITKQFTAAAVLLLEEQGRLSLEHRVGDYLQDTPEAWDEVTLFSLLTHTSGIPSLTSFPEYTTWKPFETPVETSVSRFSDKPLEFVPGERFSYSNSGYLLLGHLIERISGQHYERFLQDHVFTPLGMRNSGCDANARIIESRAAGYSPGPDGLVNAEFIHMTVPHAAGALYSTTEDLLRWTRGLFGGRLLSAESLAKMTTPFKEGYGLGVFVRELGGRTMIDHAGGIEGFSARLTYFPESRITVIALANLNGVAPMEIALQLGAVAHGDAVILPNERVEVDISADTLAEYAGVYPLAPGFDLTVELGHGRLSLQVPGQPKTLLYAESEERFFSRELDEQFSFIRGDNGEVAGLILHQDGRSRTAPRRRR